MMAAAMAALAAAQAAASPAPMKCETGPVDRQFGGTDWIVWACEDGRSMVVISASGNPATPFVFVVHPSEGHYAIDGEGNGDKAASDRAGDALRALGDRGLAELHDEAVAAGRAHAK